MRIRTYPREQIQQKFRVHCQTLAADNNAGYRKEFEELNGTGEEFPCKAAELNANTVKNRYPHILPYDHCRVKLSVLPSQPFSDYINASYVPGGYTSHDFICTQAPLPSTMDDFWRMIWEQNVQVIVMVTALKDSGKVMCNQYWPPERGTGCYGAVQVTTVSVHHGPDCYITTIHLRHRGQSGLRHVTHYYYPDWPDQGVPKEPVSLCALTERVRKHLEGASSLGPTVVHCSAGVGRSGTFVALLWLLRLCVRGVPPDVFLTVRDLRRHRVLMVQNLEQYIFVHQCLLHLLSGNTFGPSTQNASVRLQATQPERPRQSRRYGRTRGGQPERPHQEKVACSSERAPRTPHAPQPTQEPPRSLQASLLAFHPRKLLRRILSTPSLSSTHAAKDTQL
ncbi:receptor-type tyrosine-protein phosphatase V-like [Brachyhypopomus gauderio]|uniref:receptor-type tyrosine-protein phosphatase V-like n=1 Tax=Brachyhypopomus gauderio TaxID=698409 RepID=UPI004040F9DC